MDCVFTAYKDSLNHIENYPLADISPSYAGYLYYIQLKVRTHGWKPQYTFGGFTPWIISRMADREGYDISFEYCLYSMMDYASIAHRKMNLDINSYRYFKPLYYLLEGNFVEEITVKPAIYLLLLDQHAVFSETIPQYGKPIMAIQLQRR